MVWPARKLRFDIAGTAAPQLYAVTKPSADAFTPVRLAIPLPASDGILEVPATLTVVVPAAFGPDADRVSTARSGLHRLPTRAM
jgi:hypothetical protein